MKKILALVIVSILTSITAFSQTVFNKDWITLTGLPDTMKWSGSTIDPTGKLVVCGNTVVAAGNADILVAKYDYDGTIIWQQQYDYVSKNDYGVSVTTDNSGNVFVAGAVTNSSNFFDIIVLKYNASGTLLWNYVWNNAISNLHDVPSAIALDNIGNIVVTGGTLSILTLIDYITIKVNSSGSLLWAMSYDYASNYDMATSIEILASNDVVIAGASANAPNSWDFALVKYDATTGSQLSVDRVTATGVGLDQVLLAAKDASGNIYVTGFTENAGNRDIQTVKLNSSLGLLWVQNFDGDGLEDVGKAVCVDGSGNVYVTGYTTKPNGGRDVITIKYNSSGNVIWKNRYKAPNELNGAEGNSISLDNAGGIFVTGKVFRENYYQYCTLNYDMSGRLIWEDFYRGIANGDVEALDLKTDGLGNVYVTGLSLDVGNIKKYGTVKYSTFHEPFSVVMDGSGNPWYLDGRIIVDFNPEIINTQFIDDREKQFIDLQDLVPATTYNNILAKLGCQKGECDLTAVKIF